MKRFLLVCLMVVAMTVPAAAKGWTIDYAHSHLTFTATEGNAAFTGGFGKFTLTIDFDPAHPETGTINAVIDINSATAGSKDRDAYLPQPDWFNAAKFPEARFVSTAIRKTGADSYVADGVLTVKGATHPVALTFTLTPEQDHWRARGDAALSRADYHVGDGEWAGEAYVKNPVEIHVDVVATP